MTIRPGLVLVAEHRCDSEQWGSENCKKVLAYALPLTITLPYLWEWGPWQSQSSHLAIKALPLATSWKQKVVWQKSMQFNGYICLYFNCCSCSSLSISRIDFVLWDISPKQNHPITLTGMMRQQSFHLNRLIYNVETKMRRGWIRRWQSSYVNAICH